MKKSPGSAETDPDPRTPRLRHYVQPAFFLLAIALPLGYLTLPLVGPSHKEDRRARARNDLYQIGLAIINYSATDQFSRMPPIAILGPEGRPILSWRVLLLPELEQTELFEQFDLTKAWDSPENLPLVEKMPEVFISPRNPDSSKVGKTPYKAFVTNSGPWNTAWGKANERMRPSHVTDGLSNTALVIEDLADPMIWTKPEDISPVQIKRAMHSGSWSDEVFYVLFGDGSVQSFEDVGADFERWEPFLYADDGIVIDWSNHD